jgi:hypothetical protein
MALVFHGARKGSYFSPLRLPNAIGEGEAMVGQPAHLVNRIR